MLSKIINIVNNLSHTTVTERLFSRDYNKITKYANLQKILNIKLTIDLLPPYSYGDFK